MKKFGLDKGIIWIDQGREHAQGEQFRKTMLKEFDNLVGPTGANSPSQNGGTEIYSNTLAVKLRTLLYDSGLPAKFWLPALLHAVYLHNPLVHSATSITPFKGWYEKKPNVAYLQTFGSWVCVKRTGTCCCKLNLHNFTCIFLGYTATNQNIVYLDTMTSIFKSCHHAVFDKAWSLQPTPPPADKLLYNLGLKAITDFVFLDGPLHPTPIGTISPVLVLWPPPQSKPTKAKHWLPPPASLYAPLPLGMTAEPTTISAQAACTQIPCSKLSNCALTLATVMEYLIRPHNMEMIYLSLDQYRQLVAQLLIKRNSNQRLLSPLPKWNSWPHVTLAACHCSFTASCSILISHKKPPPSRMKTTMAVPQRATPKNQQQGAIKSI
jgi:hypothetical protein